MVRGSTIFGTERDSRALLQGHHRQYFLTTVAVAASLLLPLVRPTPRKASFPEACRNVRAARGLDEMSNQWLSLACRYNCEDTCACDDSNE